MTAFDAGELEMKNAAVSSGIVAFDAAESA